MPLLGNREPAPGGGIHATADDLFMAISRHFFEQVKLVTAPGTLDPRWVEIVAQAYREGFAAVVAQYPNGIGFRMVDGMLELYDLS